MKLFIYSIVIFCSVFLLVSCANIVPPTGGPRDLKPPTFNPSTSIPSKDNNRNYTKNYIKLEFDERVQVSNYQTEIYTTPSLDVSKIKVTASKNTVTLNFNQKLDSNTTYTINFGECIQDVTERNVAENVRIAFSTGPIIDSLSVSGIVLNHLSNQPATKTLVGLYPYPSDTSDIFAEKPKYYTHTDVNGNFTLGNIKEGNYEVISFTDNNKDFSYRRTFEKVGFLANPIPLTTDTSSIELRLIKEPDTLFKLLSIVPRDNFVKVKLNKAYKEDLTRYPDDILKVLKEDNNIELYSTELMDDSTIINFSFIDSLDNKIDSTSKVFIDTVSNTQSKRLVDQYYFERLEDTTYLVLEFTEPIINTTDSIKLFLLKDSTYLSSESTLQKWSNGKTKLLLFSPTFTKDTIEVQLTDSLFNSVSKLHSKSKKITYLPYNPENYGIIEGEIISNNQLFELQLIDNQFNTVKKHQNKPFYKLSGVAPGKYSFRILIDADSNGSIEPGNFNKRVIPEPIYFHEETVDVKANWEFLDVNIEF